MRKRSSKVDFFIFGSNTFIAEISSSLVQSGYNSAFWLRWLAQGHALSQQMTHPSALSLVMKQL
jgi:hypothetical protein